MSRRGLLLLWGAQDKVVPVEHGERFDREIADSELIVYPDAGHVAQLEKPRESAEDARAFLHRRGLSGSE